jgi:hypothetical protein
MKSKHKIYKKKRMEIKCKKQSPNRKWNQSFQALTKEIFLKTKGKNKTGLVGPADRLVCVGITSVTNSCRH